MPRQAPSEKPAPRRISYNQSYTTINNMPWQAPSEKPAPVLSDLVAKDSAVPRLDQPCEDPRTKAY